MTSRTDSAVTRPVHLAAITLSVSGGGVAAVSRLIWQVFRESWPDRCRLTTLVGGEEERPHAIHADAVGRLRFGARLAAAQALGRCEWVLFSHLAVARVQTFVPPYFRRPYAVFLHGIEAWRPLSATQRRVLEGADLLIANSAYTARRIERAHPWIGSILVCPLAVPAPDPRSEEVEPSSARRVGSQAVLLVGRMDATERYKGHDQLLEAWPAVLAAQRGAQLVFAGDGDDVTRLRDKARALGLRDSVFFPGFVPASELGAIYRRAALFAMPSRDEGFGLVYLEAMARGVPCIGSIHDAAGDVIEDGVSGFLVDQSDIPGLAHRIKRLLADEPLSQEMGRQAVRRWQQHFTYTQFHDRLLSLVMSTFRPAQSGQVSDSLAG